MNTRRAKAGLAAIFLSALLHPACGTWVGSPKTRPTTPPTNNPPPGVGAGTIKLSLAVIQSGASKSLALAGGSSGPTPGKNVSAVGTGLASLKLHVGSIQICNSVTLQGTAFFDQQGCKNLYQGPVDSVLDDTSNIAAAITKALTTTDGYVDVMDPTSRAALSKSVTVTADDARDYHYLIMNWSQPVKATATLTDPSDGTTPVLFTKASTAGTCTVNSKAYDCATAATPMVSGPAVEAVFAAGGNVVFKFQTPFTISKDDVANSKAYSLKIAFNPDALIQGVVAPGASNFPPLADKSSGANGNDVGNTVSLVGAQIVALFYGSDTRVMRESYTATMTSPGSGAFKLRVEMYYLENDAKKSIYGVSTQTVPTANTTGYLVGYHQTFGVTTNADQTVDLLDYQGNAFISSFARISTVGKATTAKLACDPGSTACAVGSTVNATFTLDALEAAD